MRYLFVIFLFIFSLQADDELDKAEAYFQNQEYEKAYPYYLKSANENQKSEAAYKLGWMCEHGKATELQSETAVYWYKKAAEWELSNTNQKKVYETVYQNLDPLSDEASADTLVQLATGKFGLRAYYPNYAVVSYTDQIPKGEAKYEENSPKPDPNGTAYIHTEVKYQISLRADYVTQWFGFVQMWTGAYTQKSYWQIFIDSAPFRETNYKPELFVTIPFFHKADVIGMKGIALGYKHNSNGQPVNDDGNRTRPDGPKKGSRSRSWNRLYAKAYFQWDHFYSEITAWYRIPEDFETDDNPDLLDYIGPGELELGYIHKKLLTRLTLRPSFTKGHVSGELEMSYPVPLSDNVFFYLQAFSGFDFHGNYGGYGQSLIDYDQQVNQVGFGLSISR